MPASNAAPSAASDSRRELRPPSAEQPKPSTLVGAPFPSPPAAIERITHKSTSLLACERRRADYTASAAVQYHAVNHDHAIRQLRPALFGWRLLCLSVRAHSRSSRDGTLRAS